MISTTRAVALAVIGTVGLGSILATGGGGGGNDVFDGVDDSDANILPTYGYSISALPDDSALMVTLDTTEGIYLISVDFADTLSGTVDTGFVGDDDVVLPGRIIDAGSHITIDSDAGQPLLGAFTVTVVEDVEFTFDNPPSSGAVVVELANESVRAQIVSNGVELSLNGGAATFFSWDAFDDVLGDGMAPLWQRRGALGLSGLDFVYEQALGVVDGLNLIDETLASSNPLQQMCDAFMGSPPVGVLTQGMFTLTWLGSGSVQPGDNFRWQFTDCWVDDPFNDVDQVLNGGIDLLGYTSVESGGNLTRIGFEPDLVSDGGVVFDNFETIEVVEDSLGNFAIEPGTGVTLNGGFVVVFFAP